MPNISGGVTPLEAAAGAIQSAIETALQAEPGQRHIYHFDVARAALTAAIEALPDENEVAGLLWSEASEDPDDDAARVSVALRRALLREDQPE